MKATDAQIRDLANTIAQQAESISVAPVDLPENLLRAAVTRLEGNVATLKAWTS